MTILDELAAYARVRVTEDQKKVSLEELKKKCEEIVSKEETGEGAFHGRFYKALEKPGMRFISEVKKASPSKGVISEDFPYMQIAKEYEKAGTDCISCLTEPKWFLGSDEIFKEIRRSVSVPMIRKDFTIDPYQIYQAKVMGADAVLLICSLLDTETIRKYIAICDALHLDALVETHDEKEIESAVNAGARIIGVNNRNLKDFSVDFNNAKNLRKMIPEDVLYVSESGVKTVDDIRVLKEIGADAVLIGETLMRAEDKKAMLQAFYEA